MEENDIEKEEDVYVEVDDEKDDHVAEDGVEDDDVAENEVEVDDVEDDEVKEDLSQTGICARLRSRNACQNFRRATLHRNLQEKCRSPD